MSLSGRARLFQRPFPVLLLLALLLVALPATADIVVQGESVISVRPDRATVEVAVVTDAQTAREAAKRNAAAAQAVLQALVRHGVAEHDVQTRQLSLTPLYQYEERRVPRLTGFQALNQVRIHTADIDGLGALLDAVVGAGAQRIEGIHFGVHEPQRLLDAARERAVADARRRAELYAAAAGAVLGPVLSIEEQGAAGPPVPLHRMMTAESATPVAPGQLELRVDLRVRYALRPADGAGATQDRP